jgi:hypothetical protein
MVLVPDAGAARNRGALVRAGVPFVVEVRVTNLGPRPRRVTVYCDSTTELPQPQPLSNTTTTSATTRAAPSEESASCGRSLPLVPPRVLPLGDASAVRVVAVDAATPLGVLRPGAAAAAPLRFLALAAGPATLQPLRLCAAAPDALVPDAPGDCAAEDCAWYSCRGVALEVLVLG